MRTRVTKRGSSVKIRIPNSVLDAAGLTLGSEVDVRVENGRIIAEPVRAGESLQDQLIAGITKANLHTEKDFGPAAGKEK